MATQKSTNERIRRKLRPTKIGPSDKKIASGTDIKKKADNNPNRRHSSFVNKRRHKKREVAESFLKLYRGEEVENPGRFKNLIENLIKINIEAVGKINFPFTMERLCELRESINEDLGDEVPYVIVKQVMEPREAHICPICNEEIGEKSTYLPEDQRDPSIIEPEWQHNKCGGRFKYPSSNISMDFLKSNPIVVPSDK